VATSLIFTNCEHECEDMEGVEPIQDRVPQDAAPEQARDGTLLRVLNRLHPFHSRRIKTNLNVNTEFYFSLYISGLLISRLAYPEFKLIIQT